VSVGIGGNAEDRRFVANGLLRAKGMAAATAGKTTTRNIASYVGTPTARSFA
jgi:hypothetical protein